MNSEKLKKLQNVAQTAIRGMSEPKGWEYKQIELSEFQQEASPEVVLALTEELTDARDSAEFYRRRVDLLQQWQSKMRDPERTIACDIIANGQTLPPEHAGGRYDIPENPLKAAYERLLQEITGAGGWSQQRDALQSKVTEQALEIQKLNGDIRQIADDLRAIQEIHDQQKARRYAENHTWKSSLASLMQELEDGARKFEFAKQDIEKGRVQLGVACNERDALQARLDERCIAPDIDAARELGAKGAPATESERLLFEAWMKGHCWYVVDTWNGREYDDRPQYKEAKTLDPTAMQNRQLFAAWRDSAALRIGSEPQNESETDLIAESQQPKG